MADENENIGLLFIRPKKKSTFGAIVNLNSDCSTKSSQNSFMYFVAIDCIHHTTDKIKYIWPGGQWWPDKQ